MCRITYRHSYVTLSDNFKYSHLPSLRLGIIKTEMIDTLIPELAVEVGLLTI